MDTIKLTADIIEWIRNWFEKNGPDCNCCVAISGGKDSTVVAALCVSALGKDRVIGVMMPQGEQKDIADSIEVCNLLGIKNYTVNIGPAVEAVKNAIGFNLSEQSLTNLPARIRMSTLYAISQSNNGRVVGTCNASENYIGYFTRYGDGASDVEPIGNLTVDEVIQIGDYLGLPYELVHKKPDDGLPNSSPDEEKIGFTYSELDKYIRDGVEPEGVCTNNLNLKKIDKIRSMHEKSLFKLKPVQMFSYIVE